MLGIKMIIAVLILKFWTCDKTIFKSYSEIETYSFDIFHTVNNARLKINNQSWTPREDMNHYNKIKMKNNSSYRVEKLMDNLKLKD